MQEILKPLRSQSYSVPCELCSIGSLCLPRLMEGSLHTVLDRKTKYLKNEILINQNDPLDRFYIIHSGALKTFVTVNGIEQINGFYLPGDIVGLDAFNSNRIYNNSVKALCNVEVCELRLNELIDLIDTNRDVRYMVINLLSNDISNYQKLVLSYSQKNAEEKIAYFIYSLYSHYSQRGHVSLSIRLLMSRADIANYLGITIETVSRILTRMHELDILNVRGKYVFIKDLSALLKMSNQSVK